MCFPSTTQIRLYLPTKEFSVFFIEMSIHLNLNASGLTSGGSPISSPRMMSNENEAFSSAHRRNYMLSTHRRDGLIEWMKEMLMHSFVLDAKESYHGTMRFFEELIDEHRRMPTKSRLSQFVPTVGVFHTHLPLHHAFRIYDNKYSISQRRHIAPSFNEIRHILNLAQILAIGDTLKLISFDGDQTLYDDGGNFDADNDELALAIIRLLCHDVKVAVVTAAGYGWNGSKYEVRLKGLLSRFVDENMTKEQVENFFVFGGESNYLFQCTLLDADVDTSHISPFPKKGEDTSGLPTAPPIPSTPVPDHEGHAAGKKSQRARLIPVPIADWQADDLHGPKPYFWPEAQVKSLLDVAERTMRETVDELRLRARIMRKERSIGCFPGGPDMIKKVPVGHGSNRLKREALDEMVLRVMEAIRVHDPPFDLPYCVFNGGTDAWLDIGNKRVAVAALQAFFRLPQEQCLHVGDQFLNVGNDLAARDATPCIWITSPRETGKVLQHVLRNKKIAPVSQDEGMMKRTLKEGDAAKLCVYTGETVSST